MTTLPMGGGCCNPCAPVRSVQAACEITCPGAPTEGLNYCFTGSGANTILKIKNTTTGLANRIDMVGVDEEQTMQYSNGSAC